MLENVRNFFREVVAELRKVSWPTRKEAIQSTGVVIVMVLILAVFLGVVDSLLAAVIQKLLQAKG